MTEEREANETITNLRDEVKDLYTRIDNYQEALASERSLWEKFTDSILTTYSFSDFIETMVSDEVDSKIADLDLSEEIFDKVESFLSDSTITIERY